MTRWRRDTQLAGMPVADTVDECEPALQCINSIRRSARSIGYLGIIHERAALGRRITKFLPGSPLALQGLRRGDILCQFVRPPGASQSCDGDLPRLAAGLDYTVRFLRAKRARTVRVRLQSYRDTFEAEATKISNLTRNRNGRYGSPSTMSLG